jgi:hypothetical protein
MYFAIIFIIVPGDEPPAGYYFLFAKYLSRASLHNSNDGFTHENNVPSSAL